MKLEDFNEYFIIFICLFFLFIFMLIIGINDIKWLEWSKSNCFVVREIPSDSYYGNDGFVILYKEGKKEYKCNDGTTYIK